MPPPPDDAPMLIDDGSQPPQTWQQLVGMAIPQLPGCRASAEQIYGWIGRTFVYWNAQDHWWHDEVNSELIATTGPFEMIDWDTGEALGAEKEAEPEVHDGQFNHYNFYAIKNGYEAQFRGIERPSQLGVDLEACDLHLDNYGTITREGQCHDPGRDIGHPAATYTKEAALTKPRPSHMTCRVLCDLGYSAQQSTEHSRAL